MEMEGNFQRAEIIFIASHKSNEMNATEFLVLNTFASCCCWLDEEVRRRNAAAFETRMSNFYL
jgi:hypothetical protein